jgi:hypothetical protein
LKSVCSVFEQHNIQKLVFIVYAIYLFNLIHIFWSFLIYFIMLFLCSHFILQSVIFNFLISPISFVIIYCWTLKRVVFLTCYKICLKNNLRFYYLTFFLFFFLKYLFWYLIILHYIIMRCFHRHDNFRFFWFVVYEIKGIVFNYDFEW